MLRVWAKFIPKLLTEQQEELRVEIAQDMLDCANNDLEFMKIIITGDETWIYGYDPETKFQSSQRKHTESLRPKKARQVRSNVKVMLTCFFNSRGIVHHEYVPEGQTINKDYYLEILRRLRDAVRRKRPDRWTGKNWQLHHDNAPAHPADVIKSFLAKNNMALVRQPTYSPHLVPCHFWLFPQVKNYPIGDAISVTQEHCEKNDSKAQEHSRGVQEVLPKVAEALEKVCVLTKGIF